MLPTFTGMVSPGNIFLPLSVFLASTILIVSFYGGLFSVLPAFLADIFGQKHSGAIHGRILTAWSVTAIMGPSLLSYLRKMSYDNALVDLASKVDPAIFQKTFGAPISELSILAQNKTVTIIKLLDIVPAGTPDPTPLLYDSTLYIMSGILIIGLICNTLMRPVHPKHHIIEPQKHPFSNIQQTTQNNPKN